MSIKAAVPEFKRRRAYLEDLNTTTEQHGDEPAAAFDMKFLCQDFPIEYLGDIFGQGVVAKTVLWDENGDPRSDRFGVIKLPLAVYDEQHLISILGNKEKVSKVNDFQIHQVLSGWRVDVAFKVRVVKPNPKAHTREKLHDKAVKRIVQFSLLRDPNAKTDLLGDPAKGDDSE